MNVAYKCDASGTNITPTQLRLSTYLSLAYGVVGIHYFMPFSTQDKSYIGFEEMPDLLNEFIKSDGLVNKFKKLFPIMIFGYLNKL